MSRGMTLEEAKAQPGGITREQARRQLIGAVAEPMGAYRLWRDAYAAQRARARVVTHTERVEVPVETIVEVEKVVEIEKEVYVDNPEHVKTIERLNGELLQKDQSEAAVRAEAMEQAEQLEQALREVERLGGVESPEFLMAEQRDDESLPETRDRLLLEFETLMNKTRLVPPAPLTQAEQERYRALTSGLGKA